MFETETYLVAQAGFNLKIFLPEPPKCLGITGISQHTRPGVCSCVLEPFLGFPDGSLAE